MNLPNSRKLWVLALCAGSVIAAAMTASVLLEPSASTTSPQSVTVDEAQSKAVLCAIPDELILQGHGGPSGGWSYFQTASSVSISGDIQYRCQGTPVSGQTTQFQVDILCDGIPLDVLYFDNHQARWTANFTAPANESVCAVHLVANIGAEVTNSVDETYVFMAQPENRPTVTQTLPFAGNIFYPDPVPLAATASVIPSNAGGNPPVHAIALVEFFVESSTASGTATKLGEATKAPFDAEAVVLDPAQYQFYAVATDDRGYKAVSERVLVASKFNQTPDIRFAQPAVGADYLVGAKVAVVVHASDLDEVSGPQQGLKRLSVYANEEEIQSTIWRTGPLTETMAFDWVPPSRGTYDLYAEAEDHFGAIRRIGPLSISVVAPTDGAPSARVTLPADGQFTGTSGGAFAPVSLAASASDDHEISQIEFVIAPWSGTAAPIIVPASAPAASSLYRETWTATATWTPTANDRYVIRARVKDGVGRPAVDSDPVEIYVDKNDLANNFAPKVRIELPKDKDQVRQNSVMPITIRAQDGVSEGGIEQINLYLDGANTVAWTAPLTTANGISTAMTPPSPACASCTTSLGSHSLGARARDKNQSLFRGNSPPISYTVIAAGVNAPPVSTISLPTATTALSVGTQTELSVQARDLNTDGDISKIEIFANGVRISSATKPLALTIVPGRNNEKTASMPWTPQVNGNYDLMARVTDNANVTTDSPLLKIRVNSVTGNAAPVIAISEPESGAYFELAASEDLPLRAVVNDPGAGSGGTPGIALVEFFDGSSLIGSVNTGLPTGTAQSTVTLLWDQPPEGAHAITARARDSQGTVTISEPINIFILGEAPTISILSPVSGQPGPVAPEQLWLRVDVSDDSGRIERVEYFLNGMPQGDTSADPFDLVLNKYVGAGNHTLTARAYDFAGHSTLSDPVSISIAANQLPTVAITAPTAGAVFLEGSDIPLAVVANDPDEGVINRVEYRRNGSTFVTSYSSPFGITWLDAVPGTWSLTARAVDKREGPTVSAPVSIEVRASTLPVVTMSNPVTAGNDAVAFVGETISLSANANDNADAALGGRIVKVEFHRHTTPEGGGPVVTELITTDTEWPYTAAWTVAGPGTVSFSATAYDNGLPGHDSRTVNAAQPVRIYAQNRQPTALRFHPYVPEQEPAGQGHAQVWPLSWGPWVALPAMPSLYGDQGAYDHIRGYSVQANGRIRLCAIANDADGADAFGNLSGIRFYLHRPGAGSDLLLATANSRSAAPPYCTWTRRPDGGGAGSEITESGYAVELDLTAAHASAGVQYLRAEAYDSRGLVSATPLNPAPGEVGHIPCVGDQFRPGISFQQGSACAQFSVPIAITPIGATTSPCGNGIDGSDPTCASSRFLLPAEIDASTTLQAERYDLGGQGLGTFEKSPSGPSMRPDHDEGDIHCPTGFFGPSCLLRGFDNGERRRYSVSMPSDGTVRYVLRFQPPAPRAYISKPDRALYLQRVDPNNPNSPFRTASIRAQVFGHEIGGSNNSQVKVDFRLRRTSGSPSEVNVAGSYGTNSWANLTWAPTSTSTQSWEVAARSTLVFHPGLSDQVTLVGAFSDWRPLHFGLPEPAGYSAPEEPEEILEVEAPRAEPGEFEGRAATVPCPLPAPRAELNEANVVTGWFHQDSCSIPLPANDYHFNLKSSLDGMVVDSIRFVRESHVAGPITLEIATPNVDDRFALGATIAFQSNFNGASTGSIVRYEITPQSSPSPIVHINAGAYPSFQAAWNATAVGQYTVQVFGKLTPSSNEFVSSTTRFHVDPAGSNTPPVVTLTKPTATQAPYNSGDTIELEATASDPVVNGAITSVVFTVSGASPSTYSGTLVGGVYKASFASTVTQQTDYTVSATAFDNGTPAASTISTSQVIRVNPVGGGVVHQHESAAAIPGSAEPQSDGVGATAGQFRVDESGAATYSIAILAVPGRAGVQPQMSINYSSQGGTGPMGKGWSIGGTSGISRCREAFELGDEAATLDLDGIERSAGSKPVDFSSRDRFCLDGQRLVLVGAGSYGQNGTEYRTERDQFARIWLFDVDSVPGPNYFIVQRKDGSTAWYGDRISFTTLPFVSPAADIMRADAYLDRNHNLGTAAPVTPTPGTEPAISWALARSMDSSGNYIDYVYEKKAAVGEQMLREVKFTGKTRLTGQATASSSPFASIRFDYVDLPLAEQGVSFQAGMLSQLTRRLSKIVSLSGTDVLRTYDFAYAPIVEDPLVNETAITGLHAITECAPVNPAQPNGAQVCYPPTEFHWSQARPELPGSYIRDAHDFKNYLSSKLGDINGDGRLDLVTIEKNVEVGPGGRLCPGGGDGAVVVRVFYSKSVNAPGGLSSARALDFQHSSVAEACIDKPADGASGQPNFQSPWMLFDFNGDGRDDLMVADRSDDATDGSSWGANGRWDRWHVYPAGEAFTLPGDPNGAVPRAFDKSQDLLPDCTAMGEGEHCLPVSPLGPLAQMADVNGDGLPDALYGKYNYAQGLDGFRVRLLERVPNPGPGESGLRYSSEVPVAVEWRSDPVWGGTEFPCDRPEGTNLSGGSSADPGMHFAHCSLGIGDPSFRRGRGPTVAEFNGDGSADLFALVVHEALRMEDVASLPQGCDEPDRAGAMGQSLPKGEVFLHRGNDDPSWNAHTQRLLTRSALALCHTETHQTNFHYQLVVDRIVEPGDARYPNGAVVYKEFGRVLAGFSNVRNIDHPQVTTSALYLDEPHMADFNGDGLTDLLFSDHRASAPNANSTIAQFLNLGTRMQSESEARQVSAVDLIERKDIHVFDVDGDGRDDLVLPGASATDPFCQDYFIARLTRKDGTLPPGHSGCAVLGRIPTGNPGAWLRFFGDFDGDGNTDQVAWQTYSSNGGGGGQDGGNDDNLITASSQDCGRGVFNCATGDGSRHRARHVISWIRNGYGTRTDIRYEPLTNAAVYRRAQYSRNLINSGLGTAVQDLAGPMYVVSKVESDAPTADDPAARSRLYYQYADGRVQGGGRGSLGFGEIRTIDSNFSGEHVVTISKYSQSHPFIGMPKETRKVRVASAYTAPVCIEQSPEAATNCFGQLGQSNPHFLEPNGILLSYARNLYAANEPQFGVLQPYVAAAFQVTGNPDVGASSIQTLATTINYSEFDAFGNATSTDSYIAKGTTYASLDALRDAANSIFDEATGVRGVPCATGCVKHTRTEGLTYADDVANWRLGRLTATTVRHTRYDDQGTALPTKTRTTAFAYDMGAAKTGMLLTQTLQPGRGGSEEMRSINFYDDYGNSVGSMQCSSHVALADCDSVDDFSKVLQRPRGNLDQPLLRVHRYASTTMSSDGRYVVGGTLPHFSGSDSSNQAVPRSTGTTLASDRDALGNVLRSTDAHGVWATASYGPMGRAQGSEHQVGARSLTEFHWCMGEQPNGNTQVASCPAGAVFRQTAYSLGGARGISYFDRLGRAFLAITESFNSDAEGATAQSLWSAACTGYDRRGRVVRASNPFQVMVNGSASPPVLVDPVSCAQGQHAETTTTYDYLDRATYIVLPENTQSIPAQTQMVYAGLTTTTKIWTYRDGNNDGTEETIILQKSESKDATGLTVAVVDQENLITNYAYDSADQLTLLSRQAGTGTALITSSMTYDVLGRKTAQSDPDAGASTYAYNAAGELVCAQDARSKATVTDYDALGRVWRVSAGRDDGTCLAANGTAGMLSIAAPVPTFTGTNSRSVDLTVFDTVKQGLPSKTTRYQTTGTSYGEVDTFLQTFQYDTLARLYNTATTLSVNAGGATTTYNQSVVYDTLGRVRSSTDATGGVTENMYTPHGFLRRVRDGLAPSIVYWELLATNARGQATRERRHGNVQITTRRDYNDLTGKLQSLLTGHESGGTIVNPVQDLSYRFDMQGNLLSRRDSQLRLEERFIYDRLDRLVYGRVVGINGNAAAFETANLAYDRIGNICSKDGFGYTYRGAAGCGRDGVPGSSENIPSLSPHAVKRRALAGGQFVEYSYDLAGNQTGADDSTGTSNDRRIRFNADGLADSIEVGAAGSPTAVSSFRYGAGGRYLRIDRVGVNDTVARYIGGVEWITRPGAVEERKRYIGGFLILTETGNSSTPTRAYRYMLVDHLGSLDTLVDQNGNVIEKLSFDPHGNRRAASDNGVWDNLIGAYAASNTTHGFTGHEHIDQANIIHMNGRLYDPVLGRMLSADPIIQAPFNAQNLNRYSYVLNNPLSLTDPTGLSWLDDNWRSVAAVAITAVATFACGPCSTAVAAAVGIGAGAAAGAVASASTEGAVQGAFSAAVFFGIGQYFQGVAEANRFANQYQASLAGSEGLVTTSANQVELLSNGLTRGQTAAKILAHATAGGVMSSMGGGKFGNGFITAGITEALGGRIDAIGGAPTRVTVAALVGGSVSAATGGKFRNGALTAAFSRAFNREVHQEYGDWPTDLAYDRDYTVHNYTEVNSICEVSSYGCSVEIIGMMIRDEQSAPGILLGPKPMGGPGEIVPAFISAIPGQNSPDSYIIPIGYVTQEPFLNGVRNVTTRFHAMYPGEINRVAIESGGRVWVVSHGVGTNNSTRDFRWNFIFSKSNDAFGPLAFRDMDSQLRESWRKTYGR